ncbi:MAG TPA: hypothetical protein VFW80_03200, partial [Gaiellaceae bacterium]|nr:hypothetical protein [Gaiellaceae bacterium]
ALRFRDGRIVARGRVLLTRRELVAAARRHPNLAGYDRSIPLRISVTALAEPRARELVVGMEVSARYLEPQFVAGVFRDRALVGVAASFHGPYRHLFVGSDGTLVGAENGTIFMPHGRTVDPPDDLPSGRAVAFSPDGRWIARVNGISVFLVGTPLNEEPGRIIRLPVPAQDLVWEPVSRGTAVGPPIRR